MKKTVPSLVVISAITLMLLGLQGCVVPYERDDRGDHRGDRRGFGHEGFARAPIRVYSGTYGGNCGAAYGNATGDLAAVCDGKAACEYTIDSRIIGDPAYGCRKDYVAEWQCGDNPVRGSVATGPEAGRGARIVLRCPIR